MNHSLQINACIYFEVCCFLYILTQLLNHLSKEQCLGGEYRKRLGHGWRKSIDGGLFGVLNGVVAWTGAGAGVEREKPHHRLLTGAGRGIGAGAGPFRGPEGPVTNTIHQWTQDIDIRYHFIRQAYQKNLI